MPKRLWLTTSPPYSFCKGARQVNGIPLDHDVEIQGGMVEQQVPDEAANDVNRGVMIVGLAS